MSYDKLLSDRADIYHLDTTSSGGGYGLPSEDAFSYPNTPDATGVKCYLVKRTGTLNQLLQTENMQILSLNWVCHFRYETDIRTGDRVVIDGSRFKAGIPRKVKQHHIECELFLEAVL